MGFGGPMPHCAQQNGTAWGFAQGTESAYRSPLPRDSSLATLLGEGPSCWKFARAGEVRPFSAKVQLGPGGHRSQLTPQNMPLEHARRNLEEQRVHRRLALLGGHVHGIDEGVEFVVGELHRLRRCPSRGGRKEKMRNDCRRAGGKASKVPGSGCKRRGMCAKSPEQGRKR